MFETFFQNSGLILAGFLTVLGGGEILVRGAVHLAKMLRVSALLISTTIVALGTAAPELAINIQAVREGLPDIAVGNILGSCIFNVLLILGLCAIIAPLKIRTRMLAFDLPMMVFAAVLLSIFVAYGGGISRQNGMLMFVLLVIFVVGRVVLDRFLERRQAGRMLQSNKGAAGEAVVTYEHTESENFSFRRLGVDLAFIGGGLILLTFGSQWLVDCSISICQALGISELLIGLTVLAIGSSSPEIVVSIVATLKGEMDVAVGNIVGSNTMNILCVLALTAVYAGFIPVSPDARTYDLIITLAVTLVCVPIFASSMTISRSEGIFFLAGCLAYCVFLYFKTVESPYLTAVCWTLGIIMAAFFVWALAVEAWEGRKSEHEA